MGIHASLPLYLLINFLLIFFSSFPLLFFLLASLNAVDSTIKASTVVLQVLFYNYWSSGWLLVVVGGPPNAGVSDIS